MIEDTQEFKRVNGAFPHVGKLLKLYWGEPEFGPYIEGLIAGGRGADRHGFPEDVVNALLELSWEHERLFPKPAAPEKWAEWTDKY